MAIIQVLTLLWIYVFSGVISQLLTVTTGAQVFWRLTVALLLILPTSLKKQNLRKLPTRSILICFLQGGLGYILGGWTFIKALETNTLGQVAFVSSLPWLTLLGIIISKKFFSNDLIALVISSLGVVIFYNSPNINFDLGTFYAVLSGIFIAFGQYARKLHAKTVPTESIADGVIFASLALAFILFHSELNIPNYQNSIYLFFGGFLYFASNRLGNRAFLTISPILAGSLLSLEPVCALIFESVVFKHSIHNYQIIGAAVLILSCLIPVIRKQLHRTNNQKSPCLAS